MCLPSEMISSESRSNFSSSSSISLVSASPSPSKSASTRSNRICSGPRCRAMQPKILSPSGTRRRMAQSMNEPYKIARQRLYLGRGCLVSVSVSGQWEGPSLQFGEAAGSTVRNLPGRAVPRAHTHPPRGGSHAEACELRWRSRGCCCSPQVRFRDHAYAARGPFRRSRRERSRKRAERRAARDLRRYACRPGRDSAHNLVGTESTFKNPNYLRSGGQRRCRPIALSHVYGDHIAARCWGRSHLCHLEEQLPAEGAHSPRVRGEGLVLGVLRMRQGALVTGGGGGEPRREMWAARCG